MENDKDVTANAPLGIKAAEKILPCTKLQKETREFAYRSFILFFTFISYCAFHLSRRPLSVVKNVLNRDCSKEIPPPDLILTNDTINTWCSWEPFTNENANQLLGFLDSSFLFSYAFFMFISGIIAERVNLRYFLGLGMILSGAFTILFGLGYPYQIHSYAYFIVVQFFGGAVQSSGFPSVVACMGNWFGKSRRGLIFGIWNAHLYVGNMLGAYVAGVFVEDNWGYSFIVPGLIVGIIGILTLFFLVPYPEDVGCSVPTYTPPPLETSTPNISFIHLPESAVTIPNPASIPTPVNSEPIVNDKANVVQFKSELVTQTPSPVVNTNGVTLVSVTTNGVTIPPGVPAQVKPRNESVPLMKASPSAVSLGEGSKGAITFLGALRIPGVLEFSICLFFAKLVSYTFLFWLPKYIDVKTNMGSAEDSAYLSVPFDMGGIIGGVLAGLISDRTGASAITCTIFLFLSIPSLLIYDLFGSLDTYGNIALQVLCGALVNGPYALITTAVAAELGTHKTIRENSKALATVTAIIDGTGSIGAAVGPLMAGVVSEKGWENVFYMVMASALVALLAISRVAIKEARRICRRRGYTCCV